MYIMCIKTNDKDGIVDVKSDGLVDVVSAKSAFKIVQFNFKKYCAEFPYIGKICFPLPDFYSVEQYAEVASQNSTVEVNGENFTVQEDYA